MVISRVSAFTNLNIFCFSFQLSQILPSQALAMPHDVFDNRIAAVCMLRSDQTSNLALSSYLIFIIGLQMYMSSIRPSQKPLRMFQVDHPETFRIMESINKDTRERVMGLASRVFCFCNVCLITCITATQAIPFQSGLQDAKIILAWWREISAAYLRRANFRRFSLLNLPTSTTLQQLPDLSLHDTFLKTLALFKLRAI